MEYTTDDIVKLQRDLLPDGQAYKMPFGGILEKISKALAESKVDVLSAGLNVLDVMYPDNDNFTLQDAHDWYKRLGMYDSGLVSLSDMKLAIAAKYSRLNATYYRQDRAYIEAQLRAAGFLVRVKENRFASGGTFVTKTPAEVLGYAVGDADLDAFYLDEVELDSTYAAYGITKIVQYIEEDKDAAFAIGVNLRSTFFITGDLITDFANVPAARRIEFRALCIQLKQLQLCGFMFINYV